MDIFKQGQEEAIALLRQCMCEYGFLASPSKSANYRRVWSRDGVILGLAALMTDDAELIKAFGNTLKTLASHQGPHGEIPSNVDPTADRISYGSTTGRVDADLWFVIGCGEYWKKTGDDNFLDKMLRPIERVRFLLGAWEFNARGLLYVPQTGDWADEYIHNGYVLYDQLLYLQVLRTLCEIREYLHGSEDHRLKEKRTRLKQLIQANYWFEESAEEPEHVYHKILYEKGKQAAKRSRASYWMAFFTPHGYGYRFDAFANILVSLLDVSDDVQRERVDQYIDTELRHDKTTLLPAFHPVITPIDSDWKDIHMTFSYTFKNRPHEYHNGGRWPMLSGFYVADLVKRGKTELARRYLEDIHQSNAMEMNDSPWSFPEYIHGEKLKPGGKQFQGWSAAGALIAHYAIEGVPLFRITLSG